MTKHNKPYHNYNNYSANTAAVKTEEPVVENEVMEAVAEKVEETIEPEVTVEEPVVEETKTPTILTGVVNCNLLRMRNAASTTAGVVYNLPEGTEVQIDESKSTADFYKVTIPTGAEGFCMRQFITIK